MGASGKQRANWRESSFLAIGSIGAAALTTLASLAAIIIILRVLPPAEAGRFALLVELLYALGLLGTLGQATLQARLYQQAPTRRWDWVRDLRSTIWVTFPAVGLFVAAAAIPFQLTVFEMMFLVVGAELFVLTNCLSSVLTQQRHYAWSSALIRFPNALLLLPALLLLMDRRAFSLKLLLVSLLLFLVVTVTLGAVLLARRMDPGTARITLRERLSGLVFLVSLIAIIVPQRGLIVVSGALVNAENVAALAALLSLLRVYDLIGDPAGRVFSTELVRNPEQMHRGLIAGPWLLAAALSAGLLVGLPPLAQHLYAGRYDSALPLLPWLVLASALRFVEIVPRGVLGYVAPRRTLNQFATIQSAIAVLGLVLMVKLTADHGLHGAAWSAALIAAARVICSYWFVANLPANARNRLQVEPLQSGSEESPV